MATFPRGIRAKPRLASPPRFPSGLQDWGQSGKGQFAAIQNMGRTWQEVYPVLDTQLETVRAFLEAVNRTMREGGIVWDVQHPYWHVNNGALGGSPEVDGVSQIGSNLVIKNGPLSVSGWLLAGDIIAVDGGAVVFDVTGTVNTDGAGAATIPINPPIYVGGSPSDGAAVTIDAAAIYFKATIISVNEFPLIDVTRYLDAGLTLTWREQPQ